MLPAIRDALLPAAAKAVRRPAAGDPRRILILQPDHLGDIILSEPAVRLLRQQLAGYELIAVVGPWSEEIASLAWPVDRVVAVSFPGFERDSRAGGPVAPYARLREESQRLAQLKAAHAVVLRDDAWWAAWLAKASTSGLVVAADSPRTSAFATVTVPAEAAMHRTEQAVRIASTLLANVTPAPNGDVLLSKWDMSPRIRASPGDALLPARAIRSERGIPSPYLVVHPGAGAEVKSWPDRFWRMLLRDLAPRPIVITGGASEGEMCERMARGMDHVFSAAGETSLGSLTGLLHEASLAIGTDNGPIHLAAAVGTPTVRIFGPSSAARYGPPPGSGNHIVLDAGWSCPRCGDLSLARPAGCGCMTAIQPAAVLAAVQRILGDAA